MIIRSMSVYDEFTIHYYDLKSCKGLILNEKKQLCCVFDFNNGYDYEFINCNFGKNQKSVITKSQKEKLKREVLPFLIEKTMMF
ncbi:MAG: hypothetical protein MJ066_05985 [Clostridia bacterium]|nr:hypothetical protein [Clostridia bacterium]